MWNKLSSLGFDKVFFPLKPNIATVVDSPGGIVFLQLALFAFAPWDSCVMADTMNIYLLRGVHLNILHGCVKYQVEQKTKLSSASKPHKHKCVCVLCSV